MTTQTVDLDADTAQALAAELTADILTDPISARWVLALERCNVMDTRTYWVLANHVATIAPEPVTRTRGEWIEQRPAQAMKENAAVLNACRGIVTMEGTS